MLANAAAWAKNRTAGQTRSASAGRRSTKLAMPDTDDEGSVADNASDAGGSRLAANSRGAGEEVKVRYTLHKRHSGREGRERGGRGPKASRRLTPQLMVFFVYFIPSESFAVIASP